MRRRAGDPTDSDQRRQGHGRVRARHLAAVGPANGARIAGKKVLASTCSLSPFALPLLSPEPICCPRPPATGLSNSLISETAISSAGRRSSARCSRDCWTYPVITCGIAGADTRRLEIVHQVVSIHNRAAGSVVPGDELVGTEFLQLVRFGLRRADDPLILDSIRVVDVLLKTDTPSGRVWHYQVSVSSADAG